MKGFYFKHMLQIMILILIAAFAIIAYILGWTNAIRVCEEEVLCNRQALKNFNNVFDSYILNDANILKQIRVILTEEDIDDERKKHLIRLLTNYINDIEIAYTNRRASLKEQEAFESLQNEE